MDKEAARALLLDQMLVFDRTGRLEQEDAMLAAAGEICEFEGLEILRRRDVVLVHRMGRASGRTRRRRVAAGRSSPSGRRRARRRRRAGSLR